METQTLTVHAGTGDLKVTAVILPDTEPLGAGYGLSPEQANFFKAETRIDDDDDLRAHILNVQEKAYRVSDVTSLGIPESEHNVDIDIPLPVY